MRSPVVKKNRVLLGRNEQRTGPCAAPTAPKGESASGSEARIRLRKCGEVVEAIEVDCPCGRHLEFQCLYAPPVEPPIVPETTIRGNPS